MHFDILTIFPEAFDSYFNASIPARARKKKLIDIRVHDLRRWAKDRHKTVDDRPYGGGPGMVLKIEPIYRAVGSILRNSKSEALNPQSFNKFRIPSKVEGQFPKSNSQKEKTTRIILFSAKGKVMTQADARRWAKYNRLILTCGHYEGVDERVTKYIADEEISIGEYVLTGGELPAMVVVDAVSRLIPGALGKKESLKEESFSKPGWREYPQYTRPPKFFPEKLRRAGPEAFQPTINDKRKTKGEKRKAKPSWRARPPKFRKAKIWRVPKVLLSGNHKKIEEWRHKHALGQNPKP
jgi:tRNA (guanine37-N1)-methyltransferase